tara:strand:+ start:3554 stop:4309 length:756 start_codon:yes stop_codon:yes gene_type:complete
MSSKQRQDIMTEGKRYSFTMRGENMTRIETFVAASFAFAITMMVISLGTIPASITEFVEATKQIPAFVASCALIIWIWHTHAKWSRRYGLEDGLSIFLSSSLILLVLIYIYPLRLMMQGLFQTISNGYFPMQLTFTSEWEFRFMFTFYALGFLLLCLNFVALYFYALSQKKTLMLTAHEEFDTQSEIYLWLVAACVCLISLSISLTAQGNLISYSGYIFFALFPLLTGLGFYRGSLRKILIKTIVLNEPQA